MNFRTKDGKCARCGKEKFNPVTWHCLECGNWRRPKIIRPPPTVTDRIKNPEFWQKKTMTYLGSKECYDQDVRSGVCYFCKKENRAQKSRKTFLHHVIYYHQDPLEWTIEVCSSCHWHIDKYNQEILARHYGNRVGNYHKSFIP